MARELNERMKAFVREYVLSWNASEAYRKAGYKSKNPDVDAAKLLVNPSIQAEIAKHQFQRQEKFAVTEEMVIRGLLSIANLDPADVVTWNGKEAKWKKFDDMNPDSRRALEIFGSPRGKNAYVQLRSGDKKAAWELIGKHIGMWKDKNGGIGTDPDARKVVLSRLQSLMRKRGITGGQGSSNMG